MHWLNPEERGWLEGKFQEERDGAIGGHLNTLRAIMSPQLVLLTLVYLLVGFGVYGKGFFLPLVLKTFGFSNIAVGYWAAVPNAMGVLGMLYFSRRSDKTGERVWHLVTPMVIGGIGLVLTGCAIGVSAPLTIAGFGISGSLPVF